MRFGFMAQQAARLMSDGRFRVRIEAHDAQLLHCVGPGMPEVIVGGVRADTRGCWTASVAAPVDLLTGEPIRPVGVFASVLPALLCLWRMRHLALAPGQEDAALRIGAMQVFDRLTPAQRHDARRRFVDASPRDRGIYELDCGGRVLCRRQLGAMR